MTRQDNLRRLLYPDRVAFIGGQDLAETIRQCKATGFGGEIWVVNPRHKEIAGHRCHSSVEDLPAAPDAAFIAVRRELSIGIVRALAARGAGGCVCYAAGFGEAGREGAALERELMDAAGEMAVVGPNCYGVLNCLDGVSLFPAPHGGRRVDHGVAIVSQSGNVSLNVTMNERSLPLAFVISAGNQALLELADYVKALAEDGRVTAIGLYIEGLKDVAAFDRAVARATEKGKPVVALKVGSSRVGARMALSHTGSLAGSEALYEALFDRLGVIHAASLTAMLETLKFLAISGPLPGNRLSLLTASGGDAAMAADLAASVGLEIPPLSKRQFADLRAQVGPTVEVANPLDYNVPLWGEAEGLERCFETMMEGPADATLLILDYPRPGSLGVEAWDAATDAFIRAKSRTGKLAAVASTMSESLPESVRERLIAHGVTPLQGLEDAIRALGAAAWLGSRHEAEGMGRAVRMEPLLAHGPAPKAPRVHDEWEAKRRLAEFGLKVPEGRVALAADAPAVAKAIGFPVVAKATSPAPARKLATGAMALDLRSADEVAAAVESIGSAVANISGAGRKFLIERMVRGAVAELIVGVKRDEQFGLALVIGSGGELVNLVADTRILLLPTNRREISVALGLLKAALLITGACGRPVGDMDATIDAVLAVAAFAEHHRGSLVELDINPLLVLRSGEGAVVADALIVMAAEDGGDGTAVL